MLLYYNLSYTTTFWTNEHIAILTRNMAFMIAVLRAVKYMKGNKTKIRNTIV